MTKKQKNKVNKALNCCRDGYSCLKCPYVSISDCIALVEHKATELYISEHPEIFNCEIIENADKVEIIKCKDCRYREEDHRCRLIGLLTRDYDFCSFAERKDENIEHF